MERKNKAVPIEIRPAQDDRSNLQAGELSSFINSSVSSLQQSRFVDLAESYLFYFAGGSSHTARAKRLDINHFVKFMLRARRVPSPDSLQVSDWDFTMTQRFVDDALARGEAPSTVARRLATLKHMGRTLAEKIAGYINPAREVRPPKLPNNRPQGLTPSEILQIRKKAEERLAHRSSFIRFRNLIILEFLLDTGIRADEIRQLRISQLDGDLEWLKNVRTKGRRYRNVYITTALRPKLREYLTLREQELLRFYPKLTRAVDRKLPLFLSTYRARAQTPDSFLMGSKSIWRALRELSVDTSLHPHLLRHSYALELLESSNDVRLVAQALGHSDVRTTMRYTERTELQVAQALERTRRDRKL